MTIVPAALISIALASAAAVLLRRFFWADLLGYRQNPILLDAVASPFVLILSMWAYIMSGKSKAIRLAFIPPLFLTTGPLLLTAATISAWMVKGFAA